MFSWICVAAVLGIALNKGIRKATFDLLKTITNSFLTLFSPLIVYCTAIIYLLHYFGFWEVTLIKETIVWFLGTALVLQFKAAHITSPDFFKEVAARSVKWTVVLELIMNLYIFSLLKEIAIVPVFLILLLAKYFLKREEQRIEKIKNLQKIIDLTLFSFIAVVLYKTATNYHKFLTVEVLKGFLLPIILTFAFIPFIYLFALYAIYQSFYSRINFFTKNKKATWAIERKIFWTANFSIGKLNLISSKILRINLANIDRYLKKYK
jgi:hypothetical protein